MADDIDIEEHDLLENPKLRRIFPDLSVLKKEVIDFDEDDLHFTEKTNSVQSDNLNGHLNKFCANIDILINNKSTHYAYGSNAIIPVNKYREDTSQYQSNYVLLPKVVVQNIGPYLRRSKRFCRICMVLYYDKKSFNKHRRIHTNSDCGTKENNHIISNVKNKKCDICELEFSNYGNLRRHERNIHFIENMRNMNTKIHITEVNVMVKINKSEETNEEAVSFKACFHCDMQFLSQQDLIDHLYDVLNTKKSQVSSECIESDNVQKPKLNNKTNEILPKFVNIPHKMEKEEKTTETNDLNNVYSCPICSYYFSNEKFYVGHVQMKHKVIKKMPIDKVAFNPMCKFCHIKYVDILSYNSHLRKNHKNEIIKQMRVKNSHIGKLNIKKINKDKVLKTVKHAESYIMVSKIILFKCMECHIHFLTNIAAVQHYKHSKNMKNWNCTSCQKLFKEKDAIVHKKQHELSNYFRITEVNDKFHPKPLYKCPTCAVHYCQDNYVQHMSVCESQQPKSTYCRLCDILIEPKLKMCHEKDHCLKKNNLSDFKIIEMKKTFLNYNKKVETNYSEKLIKSEPVILSNPVGIGLEETMSNGKKTYNGVIKNDLLSLNYCNVCKCNETKIGKTGFHRKKDCLNNIKYICKYCGLIFSKNSIASHKRLHFTHRNLKLQDLTFFNIKSNKVMKPPIPDFPRCQSCGKHFISKYEVKHHLCITNVHLTCHICKNKFSETAYKLHMPFHRYKMKSKQCCLQSIHETDTIKLYEAKDKDRLKVIYTCKNCDLSMNTYDEVIDHCHTHTNLNEINESAIQCVTCQIRFSGSCYKKHNEKHKIFKNQPFRQFFFDVFYFGTSINEWLRHVFGPISNSKIDKFIKDSIYKNENRIHMEVLQNGPSILTVYKCDKCACIIDCYSIYMHISNCTLSLEVVYCSFCSLTFGCRKTKDKHEKLHDNFEIDLKSYKIIIFNRAQDHNINYKIESMAKSYSVYECRYCHVLVEKEYYSNHICFVDDYKKCNICGLIIKVTNYNLHTSKHKRLKSFNENQIKVVLIGKRLREQINFQTNKDLMPTFSGIVCDYTFYECVNCNVCVRDLRSSIQHYCLIDAAKSECAKCNLIFDEGKLKGHLKLHDTDPDFSKETMSVQSFDNRKSNKTVSEDFSIDTKTVQIFDNCKSSELDKFDIHKEKRIGKDEANCTKSPTFTISSANIVKLYKCCCGLHFMQELSFIEHRNKCFGKNKSKQGNQNCSKCGLSFLPNVLFKHLLEHHGDRNIEFKFEIVDSG